MQKVKRDSRLWRFEDRLRAADRRGSLCCGVQHPVTRVGCFCFPREANTGRDLSITCATVTSEGSQTILRARVLLNLTEANIEDLIFMPLPKNENQPLYCLDIGSLFTTQSETTFN